MPRAKSIDPNAEPAKPLPAGTQLEWTNPIHCAFKADWTSAEILLEGSLGSGKTIVALDKEIDALLRWPGIPILLFRWTDDAVQTKLKPAFEEILAIRGLIAEWDVKGKLFRFPNGSVAYMFGLKSVSDIEQFNKIRGLSVSRIMGDQVEEMRRSVAVELRGRLRPDLTATMMGTRFPFQLTFIANPSDTDFWLSTEFPTDNRIKGRKIYSLSVFDNPHLPQETIDGLVRAWPPDHPKHLTMILGQRGPNVNGDPVYEKLYRKDLHWRPVGLTPNVPIWESFEVGTHNPTWAFAQTLPTGGMKVLGAIMGEGLVLEDFCSVVERYRREWLPPGSEILSCMAAITETTRQFTLMTVVKAKLKIQDLRWRENANAPDVRLAMQENIASYLRRRNANGDEAFAVNTDATRFLIASKDGVRESPIVHHSFEGGFVWSEETVSVANKEIRQAHEDGKFANVMHCLENIELNFCAGVGPEVAPVETPPYVPVSAWS